MCIFMTGFQRVPHVFGLPLSSQGIRMAPYVIFVRQLRTVQQVLVLYGWIKCPSAPVPSASPSVSWSQASEPNHPIWRTETSTNLRNDPRSMHFRLSKVIQLISLHFTSSQWHQKTAVIRNNTFSAICRDETFFEFLPRAVPKWSRKLFKSLFCKTYPPVRNIGSHHAMVKKQMLSGKAFPITSTYQSAVV